MKKVLSDHKRKGKRFIPPILQLETKVNTEIRWKYWIPEFIWLSMIIHNRGMLKSIKFIERVTELLNNTDTKKLKWFMPLSYYDRLNSEKKQYIKEILTKNDILNSLKDDLYFLNLFYNDFPLKFLFSGNELNENFIKLDQYKIIISELYNKNSVISVNTLFLTIHSFTYYNKINVYKGFELPDLNSIFTYPDSEDSRILASFIRSTIPFIYDNYRNEINDSTTVPWVKSFWDQNFLNENCFTNESNSNDRYNIKG